MKFRVNLSIVFLALLCGCYPLSESETIANANSEIQQGQMLPITAIANFGETKIQLEVAQTSEQQATGLMFRESLADNRGMLFPFAQPRVASFWMKNVPISLDIIFLNGDRVINVAYAVPCKQEPCKLYGSEGVIDQVIELRGGRAKELGIKPGDTIKIQQVPN